MADSESDGFGMRDEDLSSQASQSSFNFFPAVSKAAPSVPRITDPSILQNHFLVAGRIRLQQKLPWEMGYAGQVLRASTARGWPYTQQPFKSEVQADLRLQSIAKASSDTMLPRPQNVSATAFRRVRFIGTIISPDALRQRAITKWRILMETDLEATTAGQQLLHLAESLAPEKEMIELLHNIFDSKKTSTLVKRASSMFAYLTWGRSKGIHRPLLCDEQAVYSFAMHLLRSEAAATTAQAFKQALVFYRYMFGCNCADAAIQSTRFKGCCSRQAKRKRPLKQSKILKVDQCRTLESLTMHAPSDQDRCAAGFFTFCLLSCSRNYDANRAETCKYEEDEEGAVCVELGTLDHKTASTAEKQTTFLPLIAFSPALIRETPSGWAKEWMEARKRCGLRFGKGRPVLPALGSHGEFLDRPATSGECTAWMQELFRLGGVSDDGTTHSLKATILAWCASYGTPLSDRRLLGHHAHPTLKSVLTYSREALNGPLAGVYCMLTEIILGSFDPEAPRVRRMMGLAPLKKRTGTAEVTDPADELDFDFPWPVNLPGDGPEEPASPAKEFLVENSSDVAADESTTEMPEQQKSPAVDHETLSDSASSSSSDSSDLSLSDLPDTRSDDELLIAAGIEEDSFEVQAVGYHAFQHSVSGVIHYKDVSVNCKLVCERIVTATYTRITGELKFHWPKCQTCCKSL